MTRTFRAALLVLVMGVAACGGATDFEDQPGGSTTSTTVAGVTTTTPAVTATPVTTAGRSCLTILNDGVALARSFQMESRGVAGPPDEARFRASAQVLVNEAKTLGCPVPAAVQQFLR